MIFQSFSTSSRTGHIGSGRVDKDGRRRPPDVAGGSVPARRPRREPLHGLRLALPIAAATAVAATSLAPAVAAPTTAGKKHPATASAVQTLTLDAAQPRAQATWQKRTWQRSHRYCMSRSHGYPRWRATIKNGVCGTVVKSQPLVKRQQYTVSVSGLVSRWSGTWKNTCGAPIGATDGGVAFNASADAQWTFATKRNRFRCSILAPHLPLVGAGFRVNTTGNAAPEGWRYPWMHQPKAYVKSSHTYTFTVTGSGKSIWFSLYDHYVTDNHGHFTITVTPVTGAPAAA